MRLTWVARIGNNARMRRVFATHTAAVLLLAFCCGPLLHLHPAEEHEHGALAAHGHAAVVHGHLPDADWARQRTGADDGLSYTSHDEEKPLQVFAVIPKRTAGLASPFLVAARTELVAAAILLERFLPHFGPRAHDPPFRNPAIPRAPPA